MAARAEAADRCGLLQVRGKKVMPATDLDEFIEILLEMCEKDGSKFAHDLNYFILQAWTESAKRNAAKEQYRVLPDPNCRNCHGSGVMESGVEGGFTPNAPTGSRCICTYSKSC